MDVCYNYYFIDYYSLNLLTIKIKIFNKIIFKLLVKSGEVDVHTHVTSGILAVYEKC